MTSNHPDQLPIPARNDENPSKSTTSTRRIPKLRWGIGVLLGVGVLINYFDRINLSVAAPQLQHEFHLTDGELGWLFSGFFWSYALLADTNRHDPRPLRRHLGQSHQHVSLVCHVCRLRPSPADSAVSSSPASYWASRRRRALLASSKATGYWFPRQGTSAWRHRLFDAAAKFSNVIGVPLVALAVVNFGWRWGFGHHRSAEFLLFHRLPIIYRDPSKQIRD